MGDGSGRTDGWTDGPRWWLPRWINKAAHSVGSLNSLTLYVPKCSTTHGRFASLPTATVTFGMGWANLGSSIITVGGRERDRRGEQG